MTPYNGYEVRTIKLGEARPGQWYEIISIDTGEMMDRATRLGLVAGVQVFCLSAVRRGPVTIRIGNIELAVGRRFTERVDIRPLPAPRTAAPQRRGGWLDGITRRHRQAKPSNLPQ